MKVNTSWLDDFHEKAPYVEVIITLLFGAFIDRYFNKFLEETNGTKWFLCASLYILLVVFVFVIVYYRFFSSKRTKRFSKLEQKEEDMLSSLYNAGIKVLDDGNISIAEKVETCKIIMKVRKG